MATAPITPELRAKILASIKGGNSIASLAKTHNIAESTIRRWARKRTGKAQVQATTPELIRLRRENQQLRDLLGSILLDRELAKRTALR